MKLKLNKTQLFSGLLGAGVVSAVFLFGASSLRAAPDSEDFELRRSNARGVVQTVVRNLLNFRNEVPLSEAQKTEIQTIVKSHRDEIRAQMEKGVSVRKAFHEAALIDPESEATLAAADEIAALARSRALLSAKIRSEIWPTLTGEQQEYAEKALEEVRGAVDQVMATWK